MNAKNAEYSFLSKIRPKDNVCTVLSLNKVTKAGKICNSFSQLQWWCNEVSSDTNLVSSMAHCSFLKLLKICSFVEELYFTDSIDVPKYFNLNFLMEIQSKQHLFTVKYVYGFLRIIHGNECQMKF